MTAELRRHIRQPRARFAVLCEIDHPHGLVNVWTGSGTLSYEDKLWKGVGHIAAISGVEETSEVIVSEVRSALTNVPESELDIAQADIKGRRQMVWWAGMTEDRRVIPDPILITQVDLDYPQVVTDDQGVHTVVIVGQTGFWVLERASEHAWTPEEQHLDYPDDTGFDLVADLVDKEVPWTLT